MRFAPEGDHKFYRTLTQKDIDQYAMLSGDINPLHIDTDYTQNTRYGRPIAHGMLLFSLLCAGLTDYFQNGRLVSQELMFTNPTFPDEELTINLKAEGRDPKTALINISTEITKPSGDTSCKGKMLVATMDQTIPLRRPESEPEYTGERSYKEFSVGQDATYKSVFTYEDISDYLKLSGDQNPLYFDSSYARKFAYLDTPVPPGLLGGLISKLLGIELPGLGTIWLKQSYTFLNPAYPGQEITARVKITGFRPEKGFVSLQSICYTPFDEVIFRGDSLVLVED